MSFLRQCKGYRRIVWLDEDSKPSAMGEAEYARLFVCAFVSFSVHIISIVDSIVDFSKAASIATRWCEL